MSMFGDNTPRQWVYEAVMMIKRDYNLSDKQIVMIVADVLKAYGEWDMEEPQPE